MDTSAPDARPGTERTGRSWREHRRRGDTAGTWPPYTQNLRTRHGGARHGRDPAGEVGVQVPAQVEYERASSVDHALALLARYAPGGRILAGGHSLIPMMKLRLAQPEVLIDINGIRGLRYIERAGGELRIGALARHADLLAAPMAGAHFTILHDAGAGIAGPVVRNRGTIGGSLCQADPSEDLSAAFAALKGSMIIAGPGGSREVSARAFHTGPYETVVGPAEMLTEIRLPIRPDSGSAYLKVCRRAGDWAIGAAGAAVWLAGDRGEGGGEGGAPGG